MADSTTGLIGLEELGPEPCDGTGEDAMANRVRRKWRTAADLRLQATTGTSSQLVGLEELLSEPCDRTGEDAMSNRYRRKWHASATLPGVVAVSQSSGNAELQPDDYAAFGVWLLSQCPIDPEAQRLLELWQQNMQPASPRRKLLNPAVLASIASAAAQKRLSNFAPASDVAAIYMLNKQFHRVVLRKLEACNSIDNWKEDVALAGTHAEGHLNLDLMTFHALREHTQLVFPKVILRGVCADFVWELTGVERLDLFSLPWRPGGIPYTPQHLTRLLDRNKDSLKVLKMPKSLIHTLPYGLKLEEFRTQGDLLLPLTEVTGTLDTKVFKFRSNGQRIKLPPEFIRTVNADEIHIFQDRVIEPSAHETSGKEPSNSRVKKVVIDMVGPEFTKLDFGRIVRDVSAMCPALECFEMLCSHEFSYDANNDATYLIAELERGVQKCRAPFIICLKVYFFYVTKSRDAASDFARRHFNIDLPPACDVREGRNHYHLVKETLFDMKSLRMDFKISVDPVYTSVDVYPVHWTERRCS